MDMTHAWLNDALVTGALSGMRSMAGPTTLMLRQGGYTAGAMAILAVGEMIVDKMPFVGSRLAPAPLAGRAVMGALAGGVIARRERGHVVAGAVVGAAAALAAAYLAYHVRKRLPVPNALGGVMEDLLVVGIGAASLGSGRPNRSRLR